jgi:hypothetical protein
LAIPLFSVGAVALVMFVVLVVAKKNHRPPRLALPDEDRVRQIFSPDEQQADDDDDAEPTAAGTGDDVAHPLAETAPAIDSPGLRAMIALEAFLETQSLEERLPMMETRAGPEDFAGTSLDQPFPEVVEKTTYLQQTNATERFTDVFFHVDFATEDGGVDLHTIVVRLRGPEEDAKILGDPLLDTFGGRFLQFAAEPQPKSGLFQVIVTPLPHCHDESVPNRERKRTLRILAREDGQELARAHFSRRSLIGTMLEDPTSGLSFGQARPVTILMHWNTEENPEMPFFEALDIRRLNWNP